MQDTRTLDQNRLRKEAEVLGVQLSDAQLSQFACFYELLVERNKVMNLTAITDPEGVLVKHFLDSLAFVRSEMRPKSLIDVGSGAGFPGIPIAIALPETRITLLDSLGKRVDYLNEVSETISLKNVTAVHGRAEDFGHMEDQRGTYECCTARAVSSMPVIAEYALPLLKLGGRLVAYRGSSTDEKVNPTAHTREQLGYRELPEIPYELDLDGVKMGRRLVIFEKTEETPTKYPRRAGIPVKRPLI